MSGVLLLTGLVPTIGHKRLIQFAHTFLKGQPLHVILSSRSKEPVPGKMRVDSLKTEFPQKNISIHHHFDNDAPQNPRHENDEWFWEYWRDTVEKFAGKTKYFFASEKYGIDMAKVLKNTFVPCDIARFTYNVKGTDVRNSIIPRFDDVLPSFKKNLITKVTFFGQESVGKSTLTSLMQTSSLDGTIVPEWAREYLETIGPELSIKKLEMIVDGQYAVQQSIYDMCTTPYVFQDTDLLSTIGYYRIYGKTCPEKLLKHFYETKSDVYFLLRDNIPFVEDQLRYGGKVRESTLDFWINILEEFNCNYHIVESETLSGRLDEVENYLYNYERPFLKSIREFERE